MRILLAKGNPLFRGGLPGSGRQELEVSVKSWFQFVTWIDGDDLNFLNVRWSPGILPQQSNGFGGLGNLARRPNGLDCRVTLRDGPTGRNNLAQGFALSLGGRLIPQAESLAQHLQTYSNDHNRLSKAFSLDDMFFHPPGAIAPG
jgi:hypothetical protein